MAFEQASKKQKAALAKARAAKAAKATPEVASKLEFFPKHLRGTSPKREQARDAFSKKEGAMAIIQVRVPTNSVHIAKGKIEKMRRSILEPPRPAGVGNYYSIWVGEQIEEMRQKNPSLDNEAAMKKAAQKWGAMSDSAKAGVKADYLARKAELKKARAQKLDEQKKRGDAIRKRAQEKRDAKAARIAARAEAGRVRKASIEAQKARGAERKASAQKKREDKAARMAARAEAGRARKASIEAQKARGAKRKASAQKKRDEKAARQAARLQKAADKQAKIKANRAAGAKKAAATRAANKAAKAGTGKVGKGVGKGVHIRF